MNDRSWVRAELKQNLDKANRAGRVAARSEPRAVEAKYLPAARHLRVRLANGASLSLPVGVIPDWMSELGRLGGARSSDAKSAAARRNGMRGGRPRVA